MPHELSKEQRAEFLHSLRRYFTEELDLSLSDLQAGFFLNYLWKELTPIAYNCGVDDARRFFAAKLEDLPGTCFEAPLRYWPERQPTSARTVRRKATS
jgi:uncharacterized protein (DUF2164 family)